MNRRAYRAYPRRYMLYAVSYAVQYCVLFDQHALSLENNVGSDMLASTFDSRAHRICRVLN